MINPKPSLDLGDAPKDSLCTRLEQLVAQQARCQVSAHAHEALQDLLCSRLEGADLPTRMGPGREGTSPVLMENLSVVHSRTASMHDASHVSEANTLLTTILHIANQYVKAKGRTVIGHKDVIRIICKLGVGKGRASPYLASSNAACARSSSPIVVDSMTVTGSSASYTKVRVVSCISPDNPWVKLSQDCITATIVLSRGVQTDNIDT